MVIILMVASVLATASPAQTYALRTEADIWDVAATDLNGDGKAEIFAFCCNKDKDPIEKSIAVFMAGADGSYPPTPTLRLNIAPEFSAFFFAEVDGKPPLELVAVDAEEAVVYQFRNDQFVELGRSKFNSLFPYRSKEPFFLKHAAEDLDGDGISEWIVPQPAGYELRHMDKPIGFISCDVFSEMSSEGSAYITHRLPATHFFKMEDEKNKAVGFLSDEYADFAFGQDWHKHNRFKIPVRVKDKWDAGANMEDVNGDGIPDLIITQTKGTINMKATTDVYMARGLFSYPDKPDAEFQVSGALMNPLVRDVNGDGMKDIVLLSIPMSAWNMVNFFVRGKVSVKAEVFLFQNGAYSQKPAFAEHFLLETPDGREHAAYAFGDFNGDGHLDVAYSTTADTLAVYTGTENRLVSSKPWATFNLPAFGKAHEMKLDANKKSEDIVLNHPGGNNTKRVDVIVF